MTLKSKGQGVPPLAVRQLLEMLTYRRPAGSRTEADFVRRYIVPTGATPDGHGNYWLTVGDSPILWSCHTDTVHRTDGIQRIEYGDWIASVAAGRRDCLGADDTAGVWIMLQMIRAKLPGVYVFHRNEEIGGLGSAYIAEHERDRLLPMRCAIAFDRRGYGDVITHQCFHTASNEFAESVASLLHPLNYSPCDLGIFTDTANYSEIIGECSNLSVGYFNAHTTDEYLDIQHVQALAKAVIRADWSRLIYARQPATEDYSGKFTWHGSNRDDDKLFSYI